MPPPPKASKGVPAGLCACPATWQDTAAMCCGQTAPYVPGHLVAVHWGLSQWRSSGRTYTGITTDLSRRLRQHNGELRGGARATRHGGPWHVLCTVAQLRSNRLLSTVSKNLRHSFVRSVAACQMQTQHDTLLRSATR